MYIAPSEFPNLSVNELVRFARSQNAVQSEVAKAELVARFEPLVRSCVNSIAAQMGLRLQCARDLVDDLIQDGWVGFFKALHRFDPAFGTPLGFFAKRFIENEIGHAVRSYIRHSTNSKTESSLGDATTEFDIAESLVSDEKVAGQVENKETRQSISVFLSQLPVEQREMFVKVALGDATQADVARQRGVSRAAINKEFRKIRDLASYELTHVKDSLSWAD